MDLPFQFANGHLCHLLKVYNNRILEYHDLFSSEVPDRPTLLRSVFLWVMAALWDVLCGTRWDSRVPTGELERHQTSDLTYTPINWHSNGKWTPLKMYFLLKMGIFQPAMLICQRVLDIFVSFFGGFCYCVRCVFSHKRSARTQTSCLQRKCSSARYIKPSHLEQVFDTWWCVNIQKHCFQGFQYPLHCISRPQATYWNRNAVMECI